MTDNEDRLENMIQSDDDNYDSEDDIEELKHGVRLDQQVNTKGAEQHSGDDGGDINYPLLLPDEKQYKLEQADRDYHDGSSSGKDPGSLIRPRNKADSKHQK